MTYSILQRMKIKSIIGSLLVILVFFTSCISTKQLTYMQNSENGLNEMILNKQVLPYKVQIGDALSIRVKALDQALVGMFNPIASENNVDATSEKSLYYDGFIIDNRGEVNIPTLGKVNILNLTLLEIKQKIETKLLDEYFKEEANIFVTVKLGGIKFTTYGEIGNAGTKVILQQRVNIFEAIANSGDIPIEGNKKDVLIIRPYPGGQKIHHIDLTSVDVFQSPYYYIQPNDMIYVKPLPQKSWGTGKTGLQSFTTIISVISVLTTSYLLFKSI